jgi:hypothetical protein
MLTRYSTDMRSHVYGSVSYYSILSCSETLGVWKIRKYRTKAFFTSDLLLHDLSAREVLSAARKTTDY